MPALSVIIMGASSILLQVTALRELVSVFSGNELDIGITLSVWLAAAGTGSYAGRNIKIKNAFGLSFLLVALLSQPSLFLIHLIRPVLSAELGESLSLSATVLSTILSLTPLCVVIGAQFPLAVSYLKGGAARAYGLEAAGAFIGGVLFTFALSGKTDAAALMAAVGIVNILAGVFLLNRKSFALLLAAPLLLHLGSVKMAALLQPKNVEIVKRAESKYGKIEVLRIRDQLNIFSAGRYDFSYPDRQTEELRAHLPMTLHPSPEQVLIIGGSPAVAREILKYPVSRIDFVEIDPETIRISLGLLNDKDRGILNDKRLTILSADARRFIKAAQGPPYDLVILNLPEPSTANLNRFYTVEFFREVRGVLKQGGMIVLTLPASYGYVGKRMQTANGSVYNSLKEVFKHVEVSSEEYGIQAASDSAVDTNPDSLRSRFVKRKIAAGYFHPYLFSDAFAPLKVGMLKARLGNVRAINTDLRPAAYLYNLMVWAEMQGGGVLMSLSDYGDWLAAVLLAAAAGPSMLFWRKTRAVYYSMFLTGYSAMAFSLIIILAYQAAYGYVYEMLGLLTAIFMAGVAVGAYGIKTGERPLARLRIIEAATMLLLVFSPLLLKSEALYYVLNLLIGILAGAEFAAANQFIKERDTAGAAGKLYALDLLGSFSGALLTAIIFAPLFGIQNTILFVVVLKALSLALLFSLRYEKA